MESSGRAGPSLVVDESRKGHAEKERHPTKIQLILRDMKHILPLTGWFNSQDTHGEQERSFSGQDLAFHRENKQTMNIS